MYELKSSRDVLRLAATFCIVIAAAACDSKDATAFTEITSITVAPDRQTIDVGESVQLVATAMDPGGDPVGNVTFSWSSTASAIATVAEDGGVLGVAAGTARIRASAGGATGEAEITVVNSGQGGGSQPAITTSTFLGGSSYDVIRDVAVDAQGFIYAVGGSEGGGYPTTSGTVQPNYNNGQSENPAVDVMDVVITKLDPSGNIVWSTYLGGPNYDRAYGVEVDAQGYVYVAGRAGAGFPVTPGAFQTKFRGGKEADFYGNQDGFVCKLAPDGGKVVFCSYFGTDDPRIVRDLAVDKNGDIYLASSWSGGNYEPTIASKFNNGRKGGQDAVLAKIKADGSAVIWATYLGGSSWESGQNTVRLDPSGAPVMLFTTESSGIATANAYDRSYAGGKDLFITKLDPQTGDVIWGTYLGGPANESTETHEMTVDGNGNVYVSAATGSSNFPTTEGVFDRTYNGPENDGFVSKLSPDGSRLLASTLFGGPGFDQPEGIAVDAAGRVYISGNTTSQNFPLTADAHQRTLRGGKDAFAIILSADFSTIIYSTLLGGVAADGGRTSAVTPAGDFIFGGESQTGGWPTLNAVQPSYGGGQADGVVVRIAR